MRFSTLPHPHALCCYLTAGSGSSNPIPRYAICNVIGGLAWAETHALKLCSPHFIENTALPHVDKAAVEERPDLGVELYVERSGRQRG